MTELTKRITGLIARRDELSAKSEKLRGDIHAARQLADSKAILSATKKAQASLDDVAAELEIIDDLLADESGGLDEAIAEFENAERAAEQDERRQYWDGMKTAAETKAAEQARLILAAAEYLFDQVSPLGDFQKSDAFKSITRTPSSHAEKRQAAESFGLLPELQATPPELSQLRELRSEIQQGGTPSTAGSVSRGNHRVNFQADAADIEAARQKRREQLAGGVN